MANRRNGSKFKHIRITIDIQDDPNNVSPETVANLLKDVLGKEEYAQHFAGKQMQQTANWNAVVEELPIEEWRRKLAKT